MTELNPAETQTETCDVLIVGGGPAGSTCAGKLVEAGFDVLILDKSTFPRDKICAGWITPAVVQSLELDLDDYSRSRVLQPITGFRTGILGGNQVQTNYPETVSYGIRRCEFDAYLLERSRARKRLGESLKKIERSNGTWTVNGSIQTPLVIGAGGHFCPVSRFLGNPNDSDQPVVVAQEIEFEMTPQQVQECRIDPEIPELFFCGDLKGYAWCFRKQNVLNIGLGRENENRLADHVQSFANRLREEKRVPDDVPERFKGHAYRLYGKTKQKVADDGVLLIGDSAGLAYPQSGEGIRPAIDSALIAAELIMNACDQELTSIFENYPERLTAHFGKLKPGQFSDRLPIGLKSFLGRKLLGSHWFSRHVVINRWFLHVNQPALRVSVKNSAS